MAKELVRQKQVELVTAIVASGEVRLLANKMNAAGLMSNNDRDEITAVRTLLTDRQRAGSVVTILRNKVDIKPSNLEKFKRILRFNSEFELETTAAGSEPTKYRVTTQGSQFSSSDHSPALPDLTLVNIRLF